MVGSDDGAGGTPALVSIEAAAPVKGGAAAEKEGTVDPAGEDTDGEGREPKEEEEEAVEEEAEEEPAARPNAKLDAVALHARKRQLRLLHAACMALAWLVAAPGGAIAAHSFKHLGALWFDAHRVLQGVTVVATLFGGAIALGILHPRLTGLHLHGRLGVLLLLLTVVQPISAVLRPGKTAGKSRATWKQLHTVLGWGMVCGGAFNCVVGVWDFVAKEGGSTWWWYGGFAALATLPLLGAGILAQSRQRTILPFSFAPKSRAH